MLPQAQDSSHLLALGHGSNSVAMEVFCLQPERDLTRGQQKSEFIAARFRAQKPAEKNAKVNVFRLCNERDVGQTSRVATCYVIHPQVR